MDFNNLGILRCQERYYERIWGGSKLSRYFEGVPAGGGPIGEAWLVSDHEGDESVIVEGPQAGRTLHDLVSDDANAILGSRAALTIHGRFPLLLKILDSGDKLSVQVHPDDECAKRLGEPDVGKTEMWHVLEAEPGGELICGLVPGVTSEAFSHAVRDGSIESMMKSFEVECGTSVFVTAGTVHAIGGGIVLAEIQQNSDLTYRIYDWGRVQADGNPRELHVEKSVEATHFGSSHGGTARPLNYEQDGARRSVLSACRYFAAEAIQVDRSFSLVTRGESFHIVLVKTGELSFSAGKSSHTAGPGRALLVPGCLQDFQIEGSGEFLDYYVPDLVHDVVEPLASAGHAHNDIVLLGGDPSTSDLNL